MTNDILSAFLDFFIELDQRFGTNIEDFLRTYSIPSQNVVFTGNMMIALVKISAYSLFFILPISIMKISIRDSAAVNLFFALTLIAFAASTFAIFLGFFQLLFI